MFSDPRPCFLSLLSAFFITAPASAGIVDSSSAGFTIRTVAFVNAAPGDVPAK